MVHQAIPLISSNSPPLYFHNLPIEEKHKRSIITELSLLATAEKIKYLSNSLKKYIYLRKKEHEQVGNGAEGEILQTPH